MDNLSLQVRLAAQKAEEIMDKRNNQFPPNHIMRRTAGEKSAIGDFGEALVKIMEIDKLSQRSSSEHDLNHIILGRIEVKTSKSSSDWFNQIRFEKDWETLIVLRIANESVHAYYARKSNKLEEWDKFEINNGHCLKNKWQCIISEESPFRLLFEGSYE